jgi:DNA-binding IclR family transcriptional regulator
MRNAASIKVPRKTAAKAPALPRQSGGSQTLLRGLAVVEAAARGPITLAELAQTLGLTRSTVHRLATALIEKRYLTFVPRLGYQMGPKLLELGYFAQQQTDIIQIARPHLMALSDSTGDTVHLAVLDDERALYLDKIPGRRRVEIQSRIGDRQPLTSTGVGKALLLDFDAARWKKLFEADQASGSPRAEYTLWLERMRGYVNEGRAYDLEENEDQIRCVAAPIRDAADAIVGAISVSSAAQYMADKRMRALSEEVRACAAAIARDLGWPGAAATTAARTRARVGAKAR